MDDDPTYIWSTDDKGVTWAKEVQGTAGTVIALESWHDRTNELIYIIDWEPGNNSESWVVDYSTWSNITIAKHNGDLGGIFTTTFNIDIFLRDGNLEAIVADGLQIDARRYNNPWASIDTNPDNIDRVSRVVIVGTVAYFTGDLTGNNTVGMYSFDGATVDTLDTIAATSYVDEIPAKNMAYDGDDIIYFIANDDGTGDNYLYSYAITTDTITKLGVADYLLMSDRDTESGVKEKAWDYTTNGFSVYQLHDVIKYQLHLIAKPDITTDYKIYCVTDNFLWAISGAPINAEIWEYVDMIHKLLDVEIIHEIMEYPLAKAQQKLNDLPLEDGMLMKFYHNYTTDSGTTESIVFEGFIDDLGQYHFQEIILVSPAKEDLEEKPTGNYSGRSDQIISSLIVDYFDYITEGPLSAGTAMGTITFGGNMTAEVILDELAMFEGWIWGLSPTGKLYFGPGTIDSGENFTQISPIFGISPFKSRQEYNGIKVNGAYVDGVQMVSDWKEDLDSQQRIGIRRREFDFGFLNTVALCNIAATNILSRLLIVPQEVKFNHKDNSVGFIQPSETVTFEYASSGMTIPSDQFIITKTSLNKHGIAIYTISSDLL